MSQRSKRLRALRARRPTRPFLRWTAVGVGCLVVLAWLGGGFAPGEVFTQRRLGNLTRFLTELRPYPLQGEPFDLSVAWQWAAWMLAEKGWAAARMTLSLSVVAIVLAGLGTVLLAPMAARSLAAAEPYLPEIGRLSATRRLYWRAITAASRGLCLLLRSMPVYVVAFLLLAVFGPSPWSVIIALALHNSGILGKLSSEVVENVEPDPLAALRGVGGTRAQLAVVALFPLTFPRVLSFFFYRWETCVREATILGTLGVVSLGYWIVDARARNHYDEMLFLILVGAAMVLAGDALSAFARRLVRRAA